MNVHLNPSSTKPIYRQIEGQIEQDIEARRLRTGDLLTPISRLSEALATSPAAVRKAYEALTARGLCRREGKASYRVAHEDGKAEAWERPSEDLLAHHVLLRELQLARAVQTRLLPPALIRSSTSTIVSRSLPAAVVSGDFHEVVLEPDGRLALAVGDVAGKGLAASLIMASVKAALPFVAAGRTAAETVGELNRRLCGELARREFVALVLARYEPEAGTIELCNAGLPDPLLLTRDGGVHPAEVRAPRLPLGVREGLAYRSLTLSVAPGDRLLFYSDGIPEARTAGGEPLGYETFEALVRDHARRDGEPSDAWLDRLLELVRQATVEERQDDQTAVLLECGSPGPSRG